MAILNRIPRTLAHRRVEKQTRELVYAVFLSQGNKTASYLTSKGTHDWLYENAQKTVWETAEKAKSPLPTISDREFTRIYNSARRRLKVDLKDWKRKVSKDNMVKTLQKQNKKAGQVGGQVALGKLGFGQVNFYLKDKRLINALLKRGTKIGGIVDTNTLEQFQKLLVDRYYKHGENVYEVEKYLKDLFKGYKGRARNIAITETGGAQIEVADEVYKENGVEKKEWLATNDGNTRESHAYCAMEGAIPYDETFSNGLMYPHAYDGPPEEVCNCRCDLNPITEFSAKREQDIWRGEERGRRYKRIRHRFLYPNKSHNKVGRTCTITNK